MASENHQNTHHRGAVKDPEHDGRLKENREEGRTKGTTQASNRPDYRNNSRYGYNGSYSQYQPPYGGNDYNR